MNTLLELIVRVGKCNTLAKHLGKPTLMISVRPSENADKVTEFYIKSDSSTACYMSGTITKSGELRPFGNISKLAHFQQLVDHEQYLLRFKSDLQSDLEGQLEKIKAIGND